MSIRNETIRVIREYCTDKTLFNQPENWRGRAANQLMIYEGQLRNHFKHGVTEQEEKIWTFWNAVFYCGTIYTTIGESMRIFIVKLIFYFQDSANRDGKSFKFKFKWIFIYVKVFFFNCVSTIRKSIFFYLCFSFPFLISSRFPFLSLSSR